MNDPLYLTTDQAAKIIGVSSGWIAKRLKEGNSCLRGSLVGRQWFVDPDSVNKYKNQDRKSGPKARPVDK